jgi:hypothetical protein
LIKGTVRNLGLLVAIYIGMFSEYRLYNISLIPGNR